MIQLVLRGLAALAASFGLNWIMGWLRVRQVRKTDRLEEYKETAEIMRKAEDDFQDQVGDDPALARRWLHERQSGGILPGDGKKRR